MIINTKVFGEIDIDEEKIITFDKGILGFENFRQYTLLYDLEEGDRSHVSWLQSVEEPMLALPVIAPYIVKTDYNPIVEDELLNNLGDLTEENLVMLLTLTVPTDIKEMSVNLKAPLVINSDTRKGIQVIVDNNDYEVKYKIYNTIQKLKEEKGEREC